MISNLIEYSLKNRMLVLVGIVFIFLAGIYSARNIAVDAIPDLSDVQVIIQTEFAEQSPDIMEEQVTYPLTTAMMAVPHAKNVRGYSFFGVSFVYIIFEDGTDLYWARSRVLEQLSAVSSRLPAGVTPKIGPDATGVGWVYQYALVDRSGKHDLAQLRSIQDWYLKYELTSVPGVSEVASLGGFVKQYQVEIDPVKMDAHGVTVMAVMDAIKRSNSDTGGGLIEMGENEFMVRGLGYIKSIEDIENIPLGVGGAAGTPPQAGMGLMSAAPAQSGASGTPVLVRNVARVHVGPEIRRGVAELDGEGEVVGGIILIRQGENALSVINAVKQKLESLKAGLPEGVEIKTVYDRSNLIKRAISTLKKQLAEEIIVVAIVCAIFLFHLSSVGVAVFTLPAAVLISIIIMRLLGINANIMSLGGIAIAIGVMVDASVVMVENAHKKMEKYGDSKPRFDIILEASKELGPALFYSLLVITVSFLPVFALQEQSGRLFKPLAYTKTFSMAASSVLAVTVIPVLMFYFIRGKVRSEDNNPVSRASKAAYLPAINFVLKYRKATLIIALAALALTIIPISKVGSEFMPPLNEGDLLYMPTTDPGVSVGKAKELLQQTDKIIKQFPEVETVFGKIGRAETPTDPAPLMMLETTITLKDKKEWRKDMTMEKLVDELDRAVQFPGLTNAWTMPIRTRIDMLSTGIKTPIGVKIMGSDLETLSELADSISNELRLLPGTASAYPEKTIGDNYLDLKINRLAAARHGLTVGDVQDVIANTIGGMNVTYTVEGLERYPVNVRYKRELRDNLPALKRTLVITPSGARVPLSELADISIKKGPSGIKSENARRTAWVYVDIRNADMGSYIKKAQETIGNNIELPPGYSIVWSGQFEHMQKAAALLKIVIPVTLVVIMLLLYFHFGTFRETFIVMAAIPFSLIGGFWLLYILGYNTSVAVWVGFIALAGLDAETGVVMLVYLKHAFENRVAAGTMNTREDVREAIIEGAVNRVRPKLMTVCTTLIGLLPIMFSSGTGSEVMKRIAAPMVGGLVTAVMLELLIYPVIYSIIKEREILKPN
ncbi:MAG: Cation efflux system protein CusA [bacterium ADurb.Bin236]|nr:MAG: Cation efflux system protein CusA [bacterium ADurb.Bin236]HPN94663.1 CusA/CzcA family heavy metal efflux RND transporter [bacterium]